MSRAVVAALVAVVFAASLAAPPALGQAQQGALQTPDRFDTTTFRVTVYENGSATWTIEHRQPLANESQVDQFEAYAEEFETTETTLYREFVNDSTLLTEFGTAETGRNMHTRNYARSASVDPGQSQGTVRMSFLWTDLATTEGDRVVVSDVFDGGFYIGDGQTIVVEHGPSLAFDSVAPTPDSRSTPDSLAASESVSWVGERSFNDSRPYIALAPSGAAGEGESPTTTDSATDPSGGMGPLAVVLVLAVVVVAAVAWRSGAVAAIVDDDTSGDTAAETTTDPSPESAVAEPEFLSDSDRVIRLLEDNGGRMKQVDIVDSTEWSKSKVSMLLSDMEEDGDISKLRVGRENIISLAGEEPDAAGSPFDEE